MEEPGLGLKQPEDRHFKTENFTCPAVILPGAEPRVQGHVGCKGLLSSVTGLNCSQSSSFLLLVVKSRNHLGCSHLW